MNYFNTKDFKQGHTAYSFFLDKFRSLENKEFNKPFFVEVSVDIPAIKKSKSFILTSFGSDFAFAEAVEIINQISSISDQVKSSWNKLESLLKKHDPYCQMILVANNSFRKALNKKSIVDKSQMFFAGRELLFIEDIRLNGRILAFEPSSFVISREIEEYEKGGLLFIKKTMELNRIDLSKKSMMADVF